MRAFIIGQMKWKSLLSVVVVVVSLSACVTTGPSYAVCIEGEPGDQDFSQVPAMALELAVPSVDAAIEHYVNVLGFSFRRTEREEKSCFGEVMLGDAHILFSHRSNARTPVGRGAAARVLVDDIDALYDLIKANGGTITIDIQDRPYGLRQFYVRDLYGYEFRIAGVIKR